MTLTEIKEKIIELLEEHQGVLSSIELLWDKFIDEDYDTAVYPALLQLELSGKIQIIRSDDGGIQRIQLME